MGNVECTWQFNGIHFRIWQPCYNCNFISRSLGIIWNTQKENRNESTKIQHQKILAIYGLHRFLKANLSICWIWYPWPYRRPLHLVAALTMLSAGVLELNSVCFQMYKNESFYIQLFSVGLFWTVDCICLILLKFDPIWVLVCSTLKNNTVHFCEFPG